jgi:hypothetical protein
MQSRLPLFPQQQTFANAAVTSKKSVESRCDAVASLHRNYPASAVLRTSPPFSLILLVFLAFAGSIPADIPA